MEGKGVPSQLTHEASVKLQEGINLLLSRWTALQMAIENDWGGPDSHQKLHQLSFTIFSWFTQSKGPLYIDDLEDMLDDFMLSLNTEIADGSLEEVAEQLMFMHEECLEGNFNRIERLNEINPPRVQHIRQAVSNDEDDYNDSEDGNGHESLGNDESSEMAIDAPVSQSTSSQVEMMVEEQHSKPVAEADDGWTVVNRRSKGKKNTH